MMTSGMYSSKTAEWATPQAFFDLLNREFRFTLDPCATKKNAKCARFYTDKDDGLSKPWRGRVFMNPPYGRETLPAWTEKAVREVRSGHAAVVVGLLPSRTDTKWFHDLCMLGEIRFLKGRLNFTGLKKGGHGAPFPCMVVIWTKQTLEEKEKK